MEKTWRVLEQHQLAYWDVPSSDYGVPPALGLFMMSSLADACAGKQKQKVTDLVQAYSQLEKARSVLMGAPYVEGLDASQIAPDLNRLVTISLSVMDARKIPIAKLLAMRKREAKGRSADYREMRLRYLESLNNCTKRIGEDAKTGNDVKEIVRQFKADMKGDLLTLKQELKLASIKPLFTKGMLFPILALAGSIAEPITGITNLAATMQGVGVVPLVATLIKHKEERRRVLLSHQTSWLYLTKEKRISIR